MHTKQTVVIIGMGHTGQAIASRLGSGNFHLLLCDKDQSKAEAVAAALKNTQGLPGRSQAMLI